MSDFWSVLYRAILPGVTDLALGVISLMVPYLLWQIKQWLTAKIHDARFHCAMEKVTQATETAVLNVANTYVKEVKRSGNWGGESAATAKGRALDEAKELLGQRGYNELKGCLGLDAGEVNRLLERSVEAALSKSKASGLVMPATPKTVEVEIKT